MMYAFGPYRIDTEDRLLLRDGVVVSLTPKASDTLLLLLSRPGHVFEKQQIMSALWANSFVEEGSIAQNVSALRKALGDSVENPTYIETIPKRGYRWVAPVEMADGSGLSATRVPSSDKPRQSPLSLRAWPWVAAAGCVVLAVLLIRVTGRRSENPLLRPFTTYPGGEYGPAFSRDGRRLAFVWEGEQQQFDIYIRNVDSEDRRPVTRGPAHEGSPAWSPAGDEIAFLRYGANADSGVYISTLHNGVEQKVASVHPLLQIHDRHVDWSPSGETLAFSDKSTAEDPFRIDLVTVATGARRPLTSPPAGLRGDTGAVFSRDGRNIAFRRSPGAAVSDIYVVPVEGGNPRRLTFDGVQITAHDWSADGAAVIFCSNREGMWQFWRVSLSGGKPVAVPSLRQGGEFLSVSGQGDRLAFSQWFADTNLWRYDLADPKAEPRKAMIASTRADMNPQYSPDGSAVAFRSNRAGSDEIWVSEADGSGARAITSFRGPLTGSPRWSPDGTRIAFDSRPAGSAQIFIVERNGGAPVQVTTGAADNVVPAWSADGRRLYFASERSGTWQVWSVSAVAHSGEDGAVQLTYGGGFAPTASRDGGFVYYAKGENTPGLWRVPAGGGEERLFSDKPLAGLWGQWALGPGAVYLVDPGPADARILRIGYEGGREEAVRRVRHRPFWNDGGLAVSPDGRWILYAEADNSGSDIFMVDRFR